VTDPALNSLLPLRRQFLGFVQRRVHDPAAAEDILQNAYLRTLDAASPLRQQDSAVAWFYRILRNAIIDHYRRRATEQAALARWVDDLEAEARSESEAGPDPLLHAAACQCVAAAIDTLATRTPAYATLLRTVDLGDSTLTTYAAAHNITPGNAAVRAHRARAALRQQLLRCCGTCATHGCLDCTCQHPPRALTPANA
jgi:RNA polymerase sigma-70 factor (ECF subfamily)